MTDRRQDAYAVRVEAAELARSRMYPPQEANGDEERFADAQYFMSFTKGLPHNPKTGLLQDPNDFVEYRRAIDDGFIDPFSDEEKVRHGAKYEVVSSSTASLFGVDEGLVAFVFDLIAEAQLIVDDPDSSATDKQNAQAEIDRLNQNLENFRQWEAPTAGVVFDLQGPDAQAVTMPPAPPLLNVNGTEINPELVFEMAEVYELAVLRDIPFNDFEEKSLNNPEVVDAIARLNSLEFIDEGTFKVEGSRPRKVSTTRKNPNPGGEIDNPAFGKLDLQTVFRGSSPGVEVGPYLSQFLLIGNADLNGFGRIASGKIGYGAIQIDQRLPVAKPGLNYMLTMDDYVKVQRGIRPPQEIYVNDDGLNANPEPLTQPARRFISTPRDLATYVHYDALYEAYLNACLILLGMETPFDPAFDHLSGVGVAASNPITRRNASGFALYGGPHILNLVTEVSTRALKAVRFQKFSNHIRLRPEALAARLEVVRLATCNPILKQKLPQSLFDNISTFTQKLEDNGTLAEVSALPGSNGSFFLPMAFPEGSPMHPAYGAGHATVAGACVTILKAFFDTSAVLAQDEEGKVAFKRFKAGDKAAIYRAPQLAHPKDAPNGDLQEEIKDPQEDPSATFLTLEGELNKLAANISIGRNMAGVHYFSDYYDSLRMGEEIAIGILEEQVLTYSTDPFVLSVPTFDGQVKRIGRR
ncbi:oxidoreductase [Rubidibacter lacunae KORDI 51-2]|uniref:Oxidoreductase n=1 Tax=Rubidibacter lacunae KORDI 51-2 TaxID=582515 RepID=U5DK04_9CHRO|nr:vanadium-dependent haloperoxidase [Rubidibacter lacunae]ERN41237.1 oxidoreductase [Rubidibacter lacunae KORDI 51-2]